MSALLDPSAELGSHTLNATLLREERYELILPPSTLTPAPISYDQAMALACHFLHMSVEAHEPVSSPTPHLLSDSELELEASAPVFADSALQLVAGAAVLAPQWAAKQRTRLTSLFAEGKTDLELILLEATADHLWA